MDAADRYLPDKYRQHDPLVGDGRQAFIGYVADFLKACPELRLTIKRLVAEGDLVAAHSHIDPGPSRRGTTVVDMFRLEDGRIVEHWDVAHPRQRSATDDRRGRCPGFPVFRPGRPASGGCAVVLGHKRWF